MRQRFVTVALTWEDGGTKDGPGGACDANPVLTRPSVSAKGGLWA